MDSVGTIIFSILFVFIIGIIIYFSIDYLTYKEDMKLITEQNDLQIHNLLTSDNVITSNLNNVDKILTKKHDEDSSDLNAFDKALKNYFSFSDNNANIQNEKLFEHVFSRISPNLELLSHVNTAQGFMVNTNDEVIDDRNMKICNNEKNCIYMNVNDNGFNITPDNVNNLTINSSEKNPLAKFDLENNSIYFGGDDINSPMFIRDGSVFVNNINMVVKPKDTTYDHNDINNVPVVAINGYDLHENPQFTNGQELQRYNNAMTVVQKLNNKFLVYYRMNSSNISGNRRVQFWFNMISNFDYVVGNVLTFVLPKSEVGEFGGTSRGSDSVLFGNMPLVEGKYYFNSSNNHLVQSSNISLNTANNETTISITLSNNLPAKTNVMFNLYGWDILLDTTKTSSTGIIIGEKSQPTI